MGDHQREHRGSGVAVVLDRWPLLRIGMSRAVVECGLRVAAEVDDAGEALELVGRTDAHLLLVGDLEALAPGTLRRAVEATTVVALVGTARREELSAALSAGVLGVALRASPLPELVDVVRRAVAGERALAPPLVPVLVGLDGIAVDLTDGDGVADRPVREAGELTARERRVLVALAGGASNAEIAAHLYVSQATVKTHLAHIYAKLQVGSRHEAVSRAVALGLVQ